SFFITTRVTVIVFSDCSASTVIFTLSLHDALPISLAIAIPFLALFQLMVRLLFKTQPMNHYFSLGLWATWISSIIAVIFFSFIGAQEFKESSTIKVERPLSERKVYYITEKDVRLIEASAADKEGKKFKIELNGEDLEYALRND